jgi:ParB family chromosome partitioning protein
MTSGKQGLKKVSSGFKVIQVSLIDRPENISRMAIDQDRIKELADSIKERGLLQPIIVHPKGTRYGIIAGDRRFLAHELLGLKKIMCCVRDISGKDVKIDRAVENLQRENLTPFEEAHTYLGLRDDEEMSVEEISRVVRKSPGVVERRLAILKMPDSYQKALHEGKVNMSVAEELWSTPDVAKREYFMTMAIEHGITKEVARNWVTEYRKEKRTAVKSGEVGGGGALPFDDAPIYRACDVCRGPCDYSKIHELRVCDDCHASIISVLPKQS